MAWSTMTEDLATMEAGFDKLRSDPRYTELTESGRQYTLPGSLSDTLRTIVHPTELPIGPNPPEYVTITAATIANGNLARGVAAGVRIAEIIERISGHQTIFSTDLTGNYGGVVWMTGSASISELQQAEEKVNADPSFVDYVDTEASSAFIEGATTQRIVRRLI